MYVIILTTLVWVLFGTAIPTLPINFMQMFFFTLVIIHPPLKLFSAYYMNNITVLCYKSTIVNAKDLCSQSSSVI